MSVILYSSCAFFFFFLKEGANLNDYAYDVYSLEVLHRIYIYLESTVCSSCYKEVEENSSVFINVVAWIQITIVGFLSQIGKYFKIETVLSIKEPALRL